MDGGNKPITYTTGLLIGLDAGIAILLLLVAAILILLVHRRKQKEPSSVSNLEVNRNHSNRSDIHQGPPYSPFCPSATPVEMSSEGYPARACQVESLYRSEIPQVLIPGSRGDTTCSRTNQRRQLQEENFWIG
jgi:hypothetical protein